MARWFWLAVVILGLSAPVGAAEVDWKPPKTWVFVVGILEWERADLFSSFPAAIPNRRDEQLVKHFRTAGVPAEQIVYLQDAQATKGRIEQKLVELLDKTKSGDLLVLYFCGHGYRNQQTGQTWFASYDAGDKAESGWNIRSIFGQIDTHFSGKRALLLADCCYSGALYDEARLRKSPIEYATLTSAYSHNTSTGNWTFSDSVLAGLRGEPQVDFNGDKVIELEEVARYSELELAFGEGQKAMFMAEAGFPAQTKLAAVTVAQKPRVGQRLEVQWKDRWYRAKVIDVKGPELKIHYFNFDAKWDEWVPLERVRPYQPPQYAEGDAVQVLWKDGKTYPAKVLKAWYGLHLVRYDGYDASADEWVGPSAIQMRTE